MRKVHKSVLVDGVLGRTALIGSSSGRQKRVSNVWVFMGIAIVCIFISMWEFFGGGAA